MVHRVLILGGGFAGLYAARNLQRLMGKKVAIEVVNRENYFVFQPLLPEVAGGAISAVNAVSPLRFLTREIFIRKAEVDRVWKRFISHNWPKRTRLHHENAQ